MMRTLVSLILAACMGAALAQSGTSAVPAVPPPPTLLEPMVGTPGKDVVYLPQPSDSVDRMLDVAGVTPQDFVIDLGSGDGRNVIAAAKRGAQALGVEYNPEFVEYSKQAAAAAGVANRASFVQGDMFEADISKATVFTLFLLTDNLNKLKPKFLGLKSGTRIVSNTFKIDDWVPDETVRSHELCTLWCDLHLYIIPANVQGTWRLNSDKVKGELKLTQKYQMITGTLSSGGKTMAISEGRLRGDTIRFAAGGVNYEGRVQSSSMTGAAKAGWSAERQ